MLLKRWVTNLLVSCAVFGCVAGPDSDLNKGTDPYYAELSCETSFGCQPGYACHNAQCTLLEAVSCPVGEVDLAPEYGRRGYLEALKRAAADLLDRNAQETRQYINWVYSREPVDLTTEGATVVDINAYHAVNLHRARLRETRRLRNGLIEQRDTLIAQVRAQADRDRFIQNAIIQTLNTGAYSDDMKERDIVSALQTQGFVVAQDGRDIATRAPVREQNRAYAFDLERDIRAVIRSWSPSCQNVPSRLMQVDLVTDQDVRRVQATLDAIHAPILDMSANATWLPYYGTTIGALADSEASTRDFWLAMREALAETLSNIESQRAGLDGLSIDDVRDLARLATVRSMVLRDYPGFADIDAIVSSERTWSDVFPTWLISMVAAMAGAAISPVLPPVGLALLYAASAFGVADAVNQYWAYLNDEEAYFTGVGGPGLLSREIFMASRSKAMWAVAGALVDIALTVRQVWALARQMEQAREAARLATASAACPGCAAAELEQYAQNVENGLLRMERDPGFNRAGFLSASSDARSLAAFMDDAVDVRQVAFQTGADEAVFWSGRTAGVGGDDVARQFAARNGGTTLEQLIQARGIAMPAWDAANPASVRAWSDASKAYAEGANGVVHAVIGNDLRPGNIWEAAELPALMSNPRVARIVRVDPLSGVQTIIFSR